MVTCLMMKCLGRNAVRVQCCLWYRSGGVIGLEGESLKDGDKHGERNGDTA
jgi:hypothetical protein